MLGRTARVHNGRVRASFLCTIAASRMNKAALKISGGDDGIQVQIATLYSCSGGTYESLAPYAEWLLRAGLGAILVVHGLQKFFGWFGGAGIERTAGLLEKFGYPAPLALTYLVPASSCSAAHC